MTKFWNTANWSNLSATMPAMTPSAASTALPAISENLATRALGLYPSLAFTGVAFLLVLLAENARIPVDNPATHLELTMIHEAMLLEYSARHLALMEWSAALKLLNYACIGFALFIPWGVATGDAPNPMTLPDSSRMGIMRRPRKRSMVRRFWRCASSHGNSGGSASASPA